MASMISSVIGGGIGAASSYNKGKVEHDIARFNTQVYAANARAAAARARYELLLHSRKKDAGDAASDVRRRRGGD